ncbi:hypothetical protein [Intestinibacillus sp. Marseille-P6563]|uniref:hypothetical protein n=1 Tax=Intestinibacillus sp. Marseille-P6563 TaxID=2364792 RepID=UPI000F05D5A3|nr:hypothetical protein [Intestinibacillus sp. Marseille-P6563]
MRKKTGAAMAVAAFFILLCGCGVKSGNTGIPEKIQQTYEQLPGFTAQVKILSDLEQSTLEYGGEFEYNREDNDIFTLKTPDALAGIVLVASGESPANLTVQYDDTVFDTAQPARAGLTPADVLPLLMDTIRTGAPLETWEETVGGVKMVVARYETEDDQGRIMRQIWFTRESLWPSYAELYADDQRVMQVFFSEVQQIEGSNNNEAE